MHDGEKRGDLRAPTVEDVEQETTEDLFIHAIIQSS